MYLLNVLGSSSLVIDRGARCHRSGLELLLMMTKKSRKQRKSETAIALKTGTVSSSAGHIFPPALLSDVRLLIEGARARAAVAVNSEMVRLYWSIGERIRKDILGF
jgi:hypothetical protein